MPAPALEVRMSALDPAELHAASILVVDDEPANVRLLERVVRGAGYANLTSTTNPREVPMLCDEAEPDLILLDLNMPGVDGFGVMDGLSERIATTGYLPILVITSDTTPETRQRALAHGARDFVAKPFDFTEVLLRIHNLLDTRLLHQRLRYENEALEQRVRERTVELESAQAEIPRSRRRVPGRPDQPARWTGGSDCCPGSACPGPPGGRGYDDTPGCPAPRCGEDRHPGRDSAQTRAPDFGRVRPDQNSYGGGRSHSGRK